MALARLVWLKGGDGTIESLTGDAILIRSTIPSPPGSRLDSQLIGLSDEPGPNLRVKIHNSKKQSDGTFLLDGRVLDVTREVRQFIVNSIDG